MLGCVGMIAGVEEVVPGAVGVVVDSLGCETVEGVEVVVVTG
jgi:hypothetical protein